MRSPGRCPKVFRAAPAAPEVLRVGIDTGGTFTDCVVLRGSQAEILKVFSTPGSISRHTLQAVERLVGPDPRPLNVLHGTTVATNALLERRGAPVALVTTAGLEDLIEIGRQNRPRLYDLSFQREPPLVPRAMRLGLGERVSAQGEELRRPSRSELRRLKERIRRSGAESVAVCLLFSYLNPAHERAVSRALRALGLPVSLSHRILPEFREYERLSTTVINAYLAPLLGRYLGELERGIARRHPEVPSPVKTNRHRRASRLYVMQSGGGIMTAGRAASEPVRTILSGPAGGVMAAAWLASEMGLSRVIAFDMGGTSTDVCLLENGPRTTRETTVGGLPVAVPVVDVHSVGAGGGSLARVDAGGALRVGPESAGAVPGPVCYGRGNRQPTVTDAHLILGRLDEGSFLGGEFRLDRPAAEAAFQAFLREARPRAAWRSPQELASGILAVANATMEKALRVISVERGYDPREFTLICYGGAGGLHAAELAHSLGMRQVIVPRNPGAFSAMGVLLSDLVRDVSQSVMLAVPAAGREGRAKDGAPERFVRLLERRFSGLKRRAQAELRQDGLEVAAGAVVRIENRLEMRYRGQSYELSIPFTPDFAGQFHREHQRAYGYADAARALEIVSLRVRLTVPTAKPRLRPARRDGRSGAGPGAALAGRKGVWFERRLRDTPFYQRGRLRTGCRIPGPAIITEYSSTVVVPPGFVCAVDAYGNLAITSGK